jgi:superfamily II DNA or RNA helicase
MPAPVQIVVDSRIRIPLNALSSETRDALREEFTHDNPDHERERRRLKAGGFRRKGPPVPEKIRTWREEGGELTLPRGRLSRVRAMLTEHGVSTKLVDRRTEGSGPRPDGYALGPHIVPYEFQLDMVAGARATQNCLLRGPTGCGKSCVAARLAIDIGLCTLVLVQTRELFEQWKRRLVGDLGLREDDVGVIQGARGKIRPITIAMVQTFAKHAHKYRGVFGLLIFDEVQRAAAATFYPAVDACDAKYRVGVSADERRKDGKDFLIYDVFGKVAADVPRKTLIEQGVVLDTEIRMVPTKFETEWYADLSPDQRQDPIYFDRLLRCMTQDRERNLLIARLVVEQTRAGHLALVFSHRVEHCLSLRADIVVDEPRCGVVVGDPEMRRESEETVAGLGTGAIVAAVGTYQSIGTGIDLPAVDRGIATTPIHTNRPFVGQVRGRLCRVDRRPGATKKDSILYVLWDRAIHGLVPLRNYLRFNQGNVTVLDPDTGAIELGRAYLKQAEVQEDMRAEHARREFDTGVHF